MLVCMTPCRESSNLNVWTPCRSPSMLVHNHSCRESSILMHDSCRSPSMSLCMTPAGVQVSPCMTPAGVKYVWYVWTPCMSQVSQSHDSCRRSRYVVMYDSLQESKYLHA